MEKSYNNLLSEIVEIEGGGYTIKSIKKIENEKEYSLNTKEEKELQYNFKYFNVFWFDPNNTKDFDYFKKSFQKVKFCKGTELEKVIEFFNKESSIEEWILILPGSKCEELISKLKEKNNIKGFFIFCFKPELYKDLSKKFEKIKCITNNPRFLAKKIIEINKDYLIPIFKYDDTEKKIKYNYELNLENLESKNKYALKSFLREKNDLYNAIRKDANKYNLVCIKILKYLKEEKAFSDFEESIKDENAMFYKFVNNINLNDKERLKKIVKFLKNITLLSLYFSTYKYLLNLISYNEIKNLLSEDITPEKYTDLYNKSVYEISDKLYEKIMNNESILNQKESLKNLQIFAIIFSFFFLCRKRAKGFIEFYQVINFYRDIDFCLKYLILSILSIFKDCKSIFYNDLYSAFNYSDYRICRIFLQYGIEFENNKKFTLSEEVQKTFDNSLTIKDFIVIGDNNFYNKINNSIENKNFSIDSIKNLTANKISDYIKQKSLIDSRKKEKNCRVIFFYNLIINFDDFKKNINKICLIEAELGVSFNVILFIEDEKNILIDKMIVKMNLIPIIIVYSEEDLIKYLSKKIKLNIIENIKEILENDPEFIDFHKLEIPKINFNENNNEDYQDGCFELAETFDINLIKNKIIRKHTDNIFDSGAIAYYLYLTYGDNNALDIFFKFASLYYSFSNDPENIYLEICGVKRILYMYCREESVGKKSLYYMLNYDLRTRNPAKIYRYLELIAFINKLIENEELGHYEGNVYRATKLDEKMIVKLEPGSIMINTTFWSTTKDIKIADRFLKRNKWRNALIQCKTIKNNIDIDFEHLNYFGEKEVLFLPFTEFRVEKIIIEKKFNKKIFIIELTELGSKNTVDFKNMQIININDIDYMKFCEKIQQEKEKKEKNENKNENHIENNENKNKTIEIKKDENNEVTNFRNTFQLNKYDYNDEYVNKLLSMSNDDFNEAILLHLEMENKKKEKYKNMVKDENQLEILVKEFREVYKLSPEDYPNNKIKNILKMKDGDFDKAFEELMSFIE